MAVSIDDLMKAHWSATFFADGDDPKHIQAFTCREFPLFTKTSVKPKKGDWKTTYTVGDVEVPRGDNDDEWLRSLVDELNKQMGAA